MKFARNTAPKLGLWFAFISLFIFQGYCIERAQFIHLIGSVSLLYALYFYLLNSSCFAEKDLVLVGLVSRCALLFYIPNLSDDVYRFFWDGQLVLSGINPYAQLPSELVNGNQLPNSLASLNDIYPFLNSPNYYSVYPPINQFFFALPALFTKHIFTYSVFLKLVFLVVEIVLVYLVKQLNSSGLKVNVLWYWLNPLVIIEGVGNLHFEIVVVFFVILAIKLLYSQKRVLSALALSAAVLCKLVPLVLIPIALARLSFKNLVKFALVGFILTGSALYLVLGTNAGLNLLSSVSLYFQKFEFNASVYYVLRAIGFYFTGYNQIGILGKILGLSFLLLVFGIACMLWTKRWRNYFKASEVVLFSFYLLATTVHPWYVIYLVALSMFTKNYLALVWSCTVFLSYSLYGYASSLYPYFIALEYGVLLAYCVYQKLNSSKKASVLRL